MPKHSSGWSSLSAKTINDLYAHMRDGSTDSPPPPRASPYVVILLFFTGIFGLLVSCMISVWVVFFAPSVSGFPAIIKLLGMISLWLIGFTLFIRQQPTRLETQLLFGSILIATVILPVIYYQQGNQSAEQAFFCISWGVCFWSRYNDVRSKITQGEQSLGVVSFLFVTGSLLSMTLALLFILPPQLRDTIPFGSLILQKGSIVVLAVAFWWITQFSASALFKKKVAG